MRALLISPAERPSVSLLSTSAPLANIPLLGQTLLEYWLTHLALAGADSVLVVANDRPEQTSQLVGGGTRWGLKVKVIVEAVELTPKEACLRYGNELNGCSEIRAEVLDHFPGLPNQPIFNGYAEFFAGLQSWMSHAMTPDRLGMHERWPGVWMGVNSRISAEATLQAPCWVGQHAMVGPGARLGPGTIVEDGAFVDAGAEISASWVASHTFVGRLARLMNSIAWGNRLLNWQTGSATLVPDPFVLSALWEPRSTQRRNWLRRLNPLDSWQQPEPVVPWDELLLPKQELTHESCPER